MSLLDNMTKANLTTPYYSGGGGGGGGGPVVVASTLTVSTILGGGPGQTLDFPNGFQLPAGASIELAGAPGPTAVGDIDFTNNNGTITGLSTINGAPVRGLSTPTTSGGYFGQATANLNPSILATLSTGRWYQTSLEITDITFVTPPAATDCFSISFADGAGETNLGNFNMAQLSTARGLLGDCGFSVSGPHEAQSTIGAWQYKASAAAPSSFITTGGQGWVMALN